MTAYDVLEYNFARWCITQAGNRDGEPIISPGNLVCEYTSTVLETKIHPSLLLVAQGPMTVYFMLNLGYRYPVWTAN